MATISFRINQIYQKVDSIAKKGKDGYLDYVVYLDELVNQSEWSLFEDMMLKKYQIDIRQYKSVDDVKKKTFDQVRFLTLDNFQQELKQLYEQEGVYQTSLNIYRLSDNELLGEIHEVEIVSEKYPLYKDLELAIKEKVIIINLEVHKPSGEVILIDADIPLIGKYIEAIAILTSL